MEALRRSLACVCNDTEAHTAISSQEQYYTYMAEQHNAREGNLHLEDGYMCEMCKNRGYIEKAVDSGLGYWTIVQYACTCMDIRRNIKRLNCSGLKNVIEKYRFDNYEVGEPWQNTVKTTAQRYVENVLQSEQDGARKGWFFIGGTSGAGKSHICTAICGKLLHSGKDVHYMQWRDEAVRLKASVNESAEYQAAMNRLKQIEVLYIDDFFKSGNASGAGQRPTEGDMNLAFELLNTRYNNPNAITIISSESTLNEIFRMAQAVGGRIGERAGKQYMLNLIGTEKNYRSKLMGMTL